MADPARLKGGVVPRILASWRRPGEVVRGLRPISEGALLAILMGLEAASLRRWSYSRGKWRQVDFVVADANAAIRDTAIDFVRIAPAVNGDGLLCVGIADGIVEQGIDDKLKTFRVTHDGGHGILHRDGDDDFAFVRQMG